MVRGAPRSVLEGFSLDRLSPSTAAQIESVRAEARRLGAAVWWAGGGVRDLLLGRDVVDLDLVVERGADRLAEALARRWSGKWVAHPRFLTSTVELPGGATVDVATARREIYHAPAALPLVEAASIEADLFRRDFTVNAMAVRLEPPASALLDPFGGRSDLAAGRLKVLHDESFRDDPTRILRGLRFASRFGLRFDDWTERLARRAIAEGHFDRLTADRTRREAERLFDEDADTAGALSALAKSGLLEGLELGDAGAARAVARLSECRRFEPGSRLAAGGLPGPRPLVLALTALAIELGRARRAELAGRFGMGGRQFDLVVDGPDRVERALRSLVPADGQPVPPHVAARTLAPLEPEELLLVAAAGPVPAGWVERDLQALRPFTLAISGYDLERAGMAPGPTLGAALRATRDARLDGEIAADEELGYALNAARRLEVAE